ncbi:hypothetical protein MKW98_021107 [Papaver atlanticum]|uniref:Uncharacterized protein n=1 Tax=Papaver atlanticum TaxID=357466 RepID=A0AAD4T9Q9_9MAGN|nr:hypothetical protein MKW98_021107 [Papaver atlanticum]
MADVILCWITLDFELCAAFEPLADKVVSADELRDDEEYNDIAEDEGINCCCNNYRVDDYLHMNLTRH